MNPTFVQLLEQLDCHCEACRNDYRIDGIRNSHRLDFVESMLRALLEKLRDVHEPKESPP